MASCRQFLPQAAWSGAAMATLPLAACARDAAPAATPPAPMPARAFDDGKLFARSKDMPLPGWAAEMQVGSWAQLFLRYTISHPAVTVLIPATGKPQRQADNLKGGIGPLLTASQQGELVALCS